MTAIKSICLFFAFAICSFHVNAALVPATRGILKTPDDVSTQPLVNDPTGKFTAEITPVWSGSFVDRSKKGIVSLGVNHHFPLYIGQYRTEVRFILTTYTTLSSSGVSDTITLKISNYPDDSLSFLDKQSYTFSDVEKFDVQLIEVLVNGNPQSYLSENVYLQGDVFVDRVYDFTSQVSTALTITSSHNDEPLDLDCDDISDEFIIAWNPVDGAEEYQVEWVYINDYEKSIGDLSVDFRLNSTRITTYESNYRLSLIFDKGYICYRVRAVGRPMSNPDRVIFTPWSTADGVIGVSSCDYYRQTVPYDVLKNWQYSSTYAEQGKKKEVISFFDGSLRNRQMVTKINTDKNTIVGETIYDYQGRPAIQVLPVPVAPTSCSIPDAENSLKFHEKFNRKNSTDAYTKLDFDLSSSGDSCSIISGGMNTSSGASNYYSSSNPVSDDMQGYLPNAQNFPFSQVEYTPDNTGRVRRQGGVGPEFQLGSGHETKYFYGHPQQEQLDRLFGSEVGDYSHYQKNMVVDPNGQVSVSYLDQEGRVIATSLVGQAPDGMQTLESATEVEPISVDLFSPNLQGESSSNITGINGRSKVFNQSVLLSSKTTLEIHYDLNVTPFIDTCLSLDSSVCFNCVYDLQIQVRDMCGQLVSPSAISDKLSGHFALDTANRVVFKTDCSSFNFDTTFVIDSLPVGSYQISKILTVNENAIEEYVAMYINDSINRCKSSYQDLLEDQQGLIDNECEEDQDCQECLENLGTLVDYIIAGGTENDYHLEVDACNAPCTPISYYETMRDILRGDVMPGGQYAQYSSTSGIQADTYPLSVLNTTGSNILPKINANWKNPKYDIESTILNYYFDSDGLTKSRIYLEDVVLNGSNQVTSSIPQLETNAPLNSKVFLDVASNTYYTYPQYLLNLEDFILYYGANTSWANSLVYYHPEYPILTYYRTHTKPVTTGDRYTSESFDAEMMSTDTWTGAIAAGFIPSNYTALSVNDRIENFLTDSTHTVWDPFSYYDLLGTLGQKVAHYTTINGIPYSMMEFAAITTRCQNLPLGSFPSPSCSLWGADYGVNPTENNQIRNQEWMAFRSLYFSEKQKIQQSIITDLSINDPDYYGYNACIGNDDFNPFLNDFLDWGWASFSMHVGGQYFNDEQPCSQHRRSYYLNKEIRFGTPSKVSNKSPNEIAYQQYLVTGQCPNAASLQSVLNEVAFSELLTTPTFSMNSLNSFSGMLLSLNNFNVQTPNQVIEWNQTTLSSNVLEALWNETGIGPFATIRLVKDPLDTLGYAWTDVLGISNLYYTSLSGSHYLFKAKAKVQIGGYTYIVPITGHTTLPIGNCSFEDVCEKNDLGTELEHLIMLLTNFDLLDDTAPVNLTAETAFASFLTNRIKSAVSLNSPGAISWIYDPSIPCFKLTNASNSDYLRLGINSVSPSIFPLSSLSLIKSIDELVIGPNNTFQLVCNDINGNYLVTLNCDIARVTSGGLQTTPIGTCSLPTPLLCEGEAYENLIDLEALLADVLVNQNHYFFLYNSPGLTSSLHSQIMPTGDEGYSSLTTVGGEEWLSFNLPGDCELILKYDTIPGLDFSFDSIVSVDNMQITGGQNNLGSYNDFKLTVKVSNNGILHSVILNGSSCIPLKYCESCTGETTLEYTSTQLDSIDSVYIYSGIMNFNNTLNDYNFYLNTVNVFNSTFGLTPLDADYVQAFNMYQYVMEIQNQGYSLYEYYSYMTNFKDSIDDYTLAQNPVLFFNKYQSFASVSLSYSRYLSAVSFYNDHRDGVSLDHVSPVSILDFTSTVSAENCSDYITYLLGHIADSGLTNTIMVFPNPLTATIYPTACFGLYQDYVSGFTTYLISNPTCEPYSYGNNQLLSYNQFTTKNLCETTCGNDTLDYYLNQLLTNTTCMLELPQMPYSCPSFENDTTFCYEKLNYEYYPWIDVFNTSMWAVAHSVTLAPEYTSALDLYNADLCNCVKLYTGGHLFNYVIAADTTNLPPPLTLSEYCSIPPDIHVECKEAYGEYLGCVAKYNDHANKYDRKDRLIEYVVSEQVFYEEGLCDCVSAYCSEIDLVIDSILDFEMLPNLLTYCQGGIVVPCPNDSIDISAEPFITEFYDPCQEFYEATTENTAYLIHQDQTQAMQTDISSRYIQHCLGALENMSMIYNEAEHHFTLYYYDQAGNLIKTIPPEGVEFVDISDLDVKQAILQDRANNTHQIMTSHRMATTYLYNSLNQLVAQNIPDQDLMQVFEVTLPNGLPVRLKTTAIQMVDANQGYLTGYIDAPEAPMGTRGYLYHTTNGGQNWKRIHNTLAGNLKTIKANTNGNAFFAIGESGLLLIAKNSIIYGWDLVNTYELNVQEDFVALDADGDNIYALTAKGAIYKCTNAGVFTLYEGVPSNLLYTVKAFKDFSLQNNYSSPSGILYIATLNDGATDFDAVLLNNGSSGYTLEKVLVSDLKAVSFYSNSAGFTAGADGNMSSLVGVDNTTFVQTLNASGTLSTIDQLYMLNAQIGIARLEDGTQKTIRTTIDGGVSWQELSEPFINANLALIKRSGSSSMEISVQGYANSESYSKTILLASNGVISEMNQTPLNAQNINLKVTYAYQQGSSTTIFGINNTGNLYRSNTYTSPGTTLTYTQITDAGSTGSDPKQLLVLKDGNGVSVEVLLTSGAVKRSHCSTLTGTYTAFVNVSGAANLVWMDKLTLSATDYLLAYNSSDHKIYAKATTSVSNNLYSFNTTLTLGTSVVSKLAVHGLQVTLVGSNGGIFTSGAVSAIPTSNGGQAIHFDKREQHRLPELNSIRKLPSGIVIAGKNGTLLTRVVSTSPATALLKPLYTLSNLKAAVEYTASGNSFYLIAGSNGYARQFNTLNWQETDLYTTSGLSIETHSSGVDFNDIGIFDEYVYVVGENGTVYYNPSIVSDFFVKATSITNQSLNSILVQSFSGIIVGNQGKIVLYNAQFGVEQTQIFGPRYRDVHFEDAQRGTIVGDHFLVRTTTDGGQTWKVNLPKTALSLSSSNVHTLRKVWTKSGVTGAHFALLGGVDYVGTLTNGAFGSIPNTGKVTDFAFAPNSPLNGYISSDKSIGKIQLTPAGNGYTPVITYMYNLWDTVHTMHMFENNSVILAGGSGLICYYNDNNNTPGLYTLLNISGATFRDIYFHDNTVGYVAGDNGKFYHLTSTNNDPVTHDILSSGLSYTLQTITDPEIGLATDYNITAMAFNSRTTGVYGGHYTNSGYTVSKKAMVRNIRHEGGVYTSRFYYDRLGRIVTSQNSRQLKENSFSYTLYDELGRVYEAGEKSENSSGPKFSSIFGTNVGGMVIPSVIDDNKLALWLNENATGTKKQVTKSYYDEANSSIATSLPLLLNVATQRKRIVHVTYEENYDGADNTYDHATHYDYDIHGNVKTLLQENQLLGTLSGVSQHRFKRMDYLYDLISGNVHRVDYETGNADQWHHAYNYDADNRITEVYTSKETPLLDEHSSIESMQNEPQLSPLWDREAQYTYYAHGPLARTTLGNEEVQGIDYVYTLQGWIKGVNSNTLDANRDPGKDGDGISDNKLVARDVFGYSLHYYPTDYAPVIAGNSNFLSNQGSSDLITSGSNLYNGNIGKMVTTITNPNTREILPLGNAYRYDQLNRLKESSSFNNLDLGTNSWGSGGTTRYYNAFKYDANGNIETQLRKNHAGATIDSLTYNYHDVSGKRIRNRLYSVNDSENAGSFSDDIDDMGVFDATDNGINLNNNYSYDAEGRLVKDLQEEIAVIGWRVDGKVKGILRPTSSEKKSLSFDYDAMGHRIAKHVYASDNGYMLEKSTYYILDAQGNVMSTYERVINSEAESVSFAQTEKHIFGSSRLGMNSESIPMLGSQNNSYSMELVNHRIGERSYELSNHLGNVLSVISDKIISHDDNDDDEIDWLVADIRQSTDYSPFGVVLNERNFTPPPTLVTVPDIITVYETDFESPTVTTSGATTTIDGWSHWSSLTTIFLDNSATQRLKVVSVHGAAGAHQYLAVTPGVTHTLTVKVDKGTAPLVNILVFYNCPNITSNSGSPYALVAASSNGVYTLTFTSTTGYIFVQMRQMGTFYLDDITITKAGTSTIALSNDYRYAFQGQERDDEVSGSGNSYTAEFWQYDPRLGRRWNIDPVVKPHESPYAAFANNPIWFTDANGADTSKVEATMNASGGKGELNYLMGSKSFANLFNSFVNGVNKDIHLVFESVKNLTTSEPNSDCPECEIAAETVLYYGNKAVFNMTEKERGSLKNAKLTDFSIRIRMNTDPEFGGQEGINSSYRKIYSGVTLIHELAIHGEKLADIMQKAKTDQGTFSGDLLYTNYMDHFNSGEDHKQFHGSNKQQTWLKISNEVLNFMNGAGTGFKLNFKPPVLKHYDVGRQLTVYQLYQFLFDEDANPFTGPSKQISK